MTSTLLSINLLQNLDIDIINVIKLYYCQVNVDLCKAQLKCHQLFKACLENNEFEEHVFNITIEDYIYKGPNRGLYGYIEEEHEFEFYKNDDTFDFNGYYTSPLHLFPPVIYDNLKENMNQLYKTFLIDHSITVNLDNLTIDYDVRNQYDWSYMIDCPIIHYSLKATKEELYQVIMMVFYHFPKCIVSDIEGGCFYNI